MLKSLLKTNKNALIVTIISNINNAFGNRLDSKSKGFKDNGYHITNFNFYTSKKSRIFIWANNLNKIIFLIKANNIIFIDTTNIILISWVLFISKIFNKKIFHERTEYPDLRKKKSLFDKVRFAYYYFLCRRMNGIIVISDALKDYFIKKRVKENRIFKFPMLIDPSRFENCNRMDKVETYIAYCGDMGGNKDGLLDLINAYYLFSQKMKNIKLYLIGDTKDRLQYSILQQKVKSMRMENQIVFTGRINRQDIPSYLFNASVLVLARPNNYQAQGGFPTKLGEYLATGKPVVITRTGEIDSYLEDNKDCFFVEPDNPQAFADRLCDVFADYDFASKVGQEGKKKVYNEFNYKVQTAKLIEFIEQVV